MAGMSEDFEDLVIRHNEEPISLKDALHRALDSLLNALVEKRMPLGAVKVYVLDGEMSGVSAMIAVDLDPHVCGPECERECDEGYEDDAV